MLRLPMDVSEVAALWLAEVGAATHVGVSKLGLAGPVAEMHQRLEQLAPAIPGGLRIRRVETLDDVRATSRLRRDYFLADASRSPVARRGVDRPHRGTQY